MKIQKINPRPYTPLVLVVVFLGLILSACQSSLTPQNRTKDSLLKVKTTAAPTGSSATSFSDIAVTGGTVTVNSASLNLSQFILEENSGQNNQNGSQDLTDIGNMEGSESNNKNDTSDIIAKGPFAITLNQDMTELASVEVYAGVFKQADLSFVLNTAAPFYGNSIVAEGTFKPDQSNAIPFKIKAAYKQMLQIPLADKGLKIASNSVVPVVVRFDLARWVQNLDWATATKKNGAVLIDVNNNTALYNVFIKNLEKNTDLEEEK